MVVTYPTCARFVIPSRFRSSAEVRRKELCSKMTNTIRSAHTVALVLGAGVTLGGCHGALLGNLFVLMVSVGIFFGTLGLGRASSSRSSTTRSSEGTADQSRR
jgi:hypothetical protein